MLSDHEVSFATKIRIGNPPAMSKSLVMKILCFLFATKIFHYFVAYSATYTVSDWDSEKPAGNLVTNI